MANGPWYAQKVTGNTWNAEFYNAATDEPVAVYGVDWGDNIESVSPTVGRPYRLETGLFAARSMTGYTMGLLGDPSSPDEIQGTNKATYLSAYATITSKLPGLRIQRIEGIDPTTLSWDPGQYFWVTPDTSIAGTVTTISFAPELNVAGKYIFGASTGGWKPVALGRYRLTFYIPARRIAHMAPFARAPDKVAAREPVLIPPSAARIACAAMPMRPAARKDTGPPVVSLRVTVPTTHAA